MPDRSLRSLAPPATLPLWLLAATLLHAAPVDVTTLGVTPDDPFDDSVTITAALASHADLYFPPGVYRINTTVYIPSGRSLHGAGMYATTFELGADTVAFRVDGRTDVFLDNFGIDCSAFDNSLNEAIFVYNGSERVQLNQLYIVNRRSRAPATRFISSNDCAVRHCVIIDSTRLIWAEPEPVAPGDPPMAWQCYGSGITFSSCDGVVVEFNRVDETDDHFAVMTNPPPPYYDRYLQASSIQVVACTDALIQYNSMRNSGQGIDVNATVGALIRGNVIDNIQSHGIKLVHSAADQRLVGNWLRHCGRYAIILGPDNDEATVNSTAEHNIFVGTGKGVGEGWWNPDGTADRPACIFIGQAQTPGMGSHDCLIVGNRSYDNDKLTTAVADPVVVIRDRDGTYGAYNITTEDNLLMSGPAPDPAEFPDPAPVALPLSLTGADIHATDKLSNLSDGKWFTRGLFSQGAADDGDRWSFILDLEEEREVRSIAIYGEYLYRIDEAAPGGLVQVESGPSFLGPFRPVGSREFGGDRAANPFTGGKGKRIALQWNRGRYLRISGGPWSASFDNNVVIGEILIDPEVVLDTYDPVHNPNHALPNPAGHPQQSVWDAGGGLENERVAPALADGLTASGVNPLLNPTLTLDVASYYLGLPSVVTSFTVHAFDEDLTLLPKTGVLRASSTDSPDDMDLVLNSFDVALTGDTVVIPTGSATPYRYFQLEFLTLQSGVDAEGNLRFSEITFSGTPTTGARRSDHFQ